MAVELNLQVPWTATHERTKRHVRKPPPPTPAFSVPLEAADKAVRTQLSLYVPYPSAAALEVVRRRLDPVQSNLIPAHVTLCRGDELDQVATEALDSRLGGECAGAITLQFGAAVFFDGHGVRLPCIGGEQHFSALRGHVLGRTVVRREIPHITLAHPRNPKSPQNDLTLAAELPVTMSVTFDAASLIQQEAGAAWRVIREWQLNARGAKEGTFSLRSPLHLSRADIIAPSD